MPVVADEMGVGVENREAASCVEEGVFHPVVVRLLGALGGGASGFLFNTSDTGVGGEFVIVFEMAYIDDLRDYLRGDDRPDAVGQLLW